MRTLFIGDLHLKVNKYELWMRFIPWLENLIQDQRPDLVINLGDAMDTHAVIRSEPFNELMAHIFRVLELGIPYVYLKGNHDQSSPKDSKYHALLPFKGKIPNLYIVDEVTELFGMTFVPYLHDATLFPNATLPICVAHQTFLGADYGPINAKEGVDPKTIQGCEIFVSGHIHKKSNVDNVVYVGSPYSQDASDVNQVKGISILDTDTLNFQFFPNPLPAWRSFKFEIGQDGSIEQLHVNLTTAIKGTTDHWIVELCGPKAEIVGYLDSAQYKKLIKDVSIRLKTVFTDKEKRKISIEATSMENILAEYVNKVYNGSINKEELLTKTRELLISK